MADEILRSRHAFGSSVNLSAAISAGKIDAYDILFLDGDTKPKIGWLDRNGDLKLVKSECIIPVDSLPTSGEDGKIYIFNGEGYFWDGKDFINLCKPTDLTELEAKVTKKADLSEVKASYERIKYEISSKPEGTLVDHRDKEIRVMVPADTKWVKQTVGGTGNANMYYMGFKAYAPEGAVSFKEGDQGVIKDEMFDFTGDFAGTDEFGRNYSIVWLALASYDAASDTWTYFGKNSSTEKYIGWTYVVEWYNKDSVVIESDCIRINLSNENCHSSIKPSYIGSAVNEAKTYTDEQIDAILNSMTIIEF